MASQAPAEPVRNRRVVTRDGLVAGFLGGLTAVVFFFIVDLFSTAPLRTPSSLAAALFGLAPEAVGGGQVVGLLVVHLTVFALVGVAAVWLFRLAQIPENVLLGAVFGAFVYTLLFYLALSLSHVVDLPIPGWGLVLVGNILAGVVLGGYLHRVGPLPGHGQRLGLVLEHPVFREGAVIGLMGAGLVAVWFLIMDVALREALFTPAALGSMLFFAAEGAEEVVISATTVIGYTFVHVLAFLVVGWVVAGAVAGLEKYPSLVSAIILLFIFFGVMFAALVTVLGLWILAELAVWSVLVGNLLAAGAMGAYLWRRHPILREEVRSGAIWEAI